jgi:hypothetical protein
MIAVDPTSKGLDDTLIPPIISGEWFCGVGVEFGPQHTGHNSKTTRTLRKNLEIRGILFIGSSSQEFRGGY